MFSRMKNAPRILFNSLLTQRYRKSLWLKHIVRCQEEIAALPDAHPYYQTAYMREEVKYWLHIAKWMYEDSKKRQVRRCLDIGCAYGVLSLFAKKIFNCQVHCTDVTHAYLSQTLIQKYSFVFSCNNIELDPFHWHARFDAIIMTEVLEHLNFHPLPTLKAIHTLLAEGGRLYLSTPDASRWGTVTKYYPSLDQIPEPIKGSRFVDSHIWQYNKEELFGVLDSAGFRVDQFAYSPGVLNRHFNLVAVPN